MTVHELPPPPTLERPDVDWERHKGTGAPKILPPPGTEWRSPSGKTRQRHRYYTRVTTYADAITDTYNLMAWKLRRVALGMGQRPDYVRLASALTDRDDDRDALDELVGKALEAAGPNRADEGTALHALTERIDRGEDLGNPPAELERDLAAYAALSERALRFVERECRVVCDELETAGTPDGIAYVAEQCPAGCGPDVLHVIDTKTGSIRYPSKMATQLAIYSRSDRYDPVTGERSSLGNVCRKWGAIVHLPVEQGRAAPFWLDLEHGWAGAELCGPVRRWNAARGDEVIRPFAEIPPLEVTAGGEIVEAERRLGSDKGGSPAPSPVVELPAPTPVADWTVDRPRAAYEAAVRAADTLQALTEVAVPNRDAEWMTPELRALAHARWWELRGEPAREGRTTVAVVELPGAAR